MSLKEKTFSTKTFGKECRLLKPKEFKKVLKFGKRFNARGFLCFALLDKTDPNKKRIGIAVSSKIANSVNRNRIKRLIREFFRNNKKKFPTGDFFISVKDAGVFKNYKSTELAFDSFFKKIDTMK